MIENKQRRVTRVEVFGLLACIAGALIAAVVILSVFLDEPEENPGLAARLAGLFVSTLGVVPALLLAIPVASLGARTFLSGRPDRFVHHLSGVCGASVGLAVLLGAFSETAGGAVGAYSGGLLSRYLTMVPAALLGLVVLAIPVWLTWLREFDLPFGEKRKTRRSSPGHIDEPIGGVSSEEAAALLPIPEGDGEAPEWALQNNATAPYPEDVRLKGEIPPGAAPLLESDDETETSPQLPAPSLHRWTAGRAESPADATARDVADDDGEQEGLRETPPAHDPSGTGELPGIGERTLLTPEGGTGPERETASREESVLAEAAEGATPDPARVPLGTEPRATLAEESAAPPESNLKIIRPEVTPPRPSWEQEDLFDGGEAPEGESDGTRAVTARSEAAEIAEVLATPDSVEEEEEETEERIAPATSDSEEDLDDEALLAAEEELDGDEAEEEEAEAGEDLDEEYEYVDEESGEEGEGEEEGEYEDEDEYEEDEEDDVDDEDEEYETEDGEEDDEEIEPGASAKADDDELGEDEEWEYEYEYVEVDEEGEDAEESDQEPDEAEETAEEEASEEQEPVRATADDGPAEEAEPKPPEEPQTTPEPAEASVVLTPAAAAPDASEVQMNLFGDSGRAGAGSTAEVEPVVELQPRPPRSSGLSERAHVVAEMILEEQRVAVSMVQRRFGIDFAESCAILDELQGLGFIGPYVDGKTRDILMSREEWLAAVTPD